MALTLRDELANYLPPHSGGLFGAIRKHDIHTGIDLYCKPNTSVISLTDGIVCDIGKFTGASVGSPWWNETEYLVVKSNIGYVLYGEIQSNLPLGTSVLVGQTLGNVKQVLRKDKGLPICMLHLELYSIYKEPVIWNLGETQPIGLIDPTNLVIL